MGNSGKSWRRRRQRGKLAPKAPVKKGEREGRRGKRAGNGEKKRKRGEAREKRGKFLSDFLGGGNF